VETRTELPVTARAGHRTQLACAAGGFIAPPVGFLANGLLGPLVTEITLQLRRAEGARPAIGSTLQAIAGGVTYGLSLNLMAFTTWRAVSRP
jgi:uncharacterized protein YqgC (DUF456 family)